ncbi:hypothetical protein C8J57DRAFT_1486409 [Mycena rebaudengoi]|nr:hypothetical protein C8J57DRAFT_1486409 [Mycena rebaudengoi]
MEIPAESLTILVWPITTITITITVALVAALVILVIIFLYFIHTTPRSFSPRPLSPRTLSPPPYTAPPSAPDTSISKKARRRNARQETALHQVRAMERTRSQLHADMDSLTAKNATISAEVVTLRAQAAHLHKWMTKTVAPVYLCLLAKGLASYAFWHRRGLYPATTKLSMAQLSYLNETLESTNDRDTFRAAQAIVRRTPIPPPGGRAYVSGTLEHRYPGIESCGSLSGNGATATLIDTAMIRTLKNKWVNVLDDRNRAAHEASATDIAEFLQYVDDIQDYEKYPTTHGYCIPNFSVWASYYAILFGFQYQDIGMQNDASQSQVLTNSGSLDTIHVDDDEGLGET